METIQCDVLVIGAGIMGLTAAAKLSETRSVVLVEKFPQFGRETSSRNSEVIHSGIYYGNDTQKTLHCIRGREKLYAFCAEKNVPHAATGKIVVATQPEEEAYLDKLFQHCQKLDVPAERWTAEQIQKREPEINAFSGVFLPRTGIVDSHVFMHAHERLIEERGGLIAYRHEVRTIEKSGENWITEVAGPDEALRIESPLVVNASGLGAAELSNVTLKTNRYQHKFCRGRYFTLSSAFQNKFRTLIYPVPPKDGLGIHITIDLSGAARLGPDVDWSAVTQYADIDQIYDCDWDSLIDPFVQASRRYCDKIEAKHVQPGLIGIRPKLFLGGKASADFLVENHGGFIHCLGIESPGLTSSLSLAEKVCELI